MRTGDWVRVIGLDVDGGSSRLRQIGKVLYQMGEFVAVIFGKTAALFKISSLKEYHVSRKP